MGSYTDKPQSDIPFRDIFMRLAQKETMDSFEVAQFFDERDGVFSYYYSQARIVAQEINSF